MAKIDKTFQDLYKLIFDEGRLYHNTRRDCTRLQIPSYTFRHEFKDGFPAITLKELQYKSVVGELLWFLKGNESLDFLHDNGITIWDKDSKNYEAKTGSANSAGRHYGVQWRDFNRNSDQIKTLLKNTISDIMGSRLVVSCWNPSELEQTALPPCIPMFQIVGVPLTLYERANLYNIKAFYGGYSSVYINLWKPTPGYNTVDEFMDADDIPKYGFELHWNQRSTDAFLGLPFDVASYATLALLIEEITGFKALAIQGDLKCVHFYDNQFEVSNEIIKRDSDKFGRCNLEFKPVSLFDFKNTYQLEGLDKLVDKMQINMFNLVGYESYPGLQVPMLAPKE